MGQPPVKVGVVDIGTNSMRLLVTDGLEESGRWVEVTGLGRGVDATGRLGDEELARTISVLGRFGEIMDREGVDRRAAMATSATRDAVNREAFMRNAASALGVTPEVIAGEREGELAFAGAIEGLGEGAYVVSDIGGGSSEFVTSEGAASIDIGSVRLTDRILTDRPASSDQLERAFSHVRRLFASVSVTGDLVGVAGTWTSLAAIDLGLADYDRRRVHHHSMRRGALGELTGRLAGMSVEQTAAIPSLDPARAPVILSGAVVAECVMDTVGADEALISEQDTLDGLARELLGLT